MKTLLALLLMLQSFGLIAGAARSERSSQLWMYCSQNLWVDKNVEALEELFRQAARAGYTHVLLADSKFSKLQDMDQRYFRNIERLKMVARECNLQIVPAVFQIGYSNDLLWHDPNLIEALPVKDALFVVQNRIATLQPDPPVLLKGGDFAKLTEWTWKDDTVTADGETALIQDPKGQNARIVQTLKLTPFRQYHFSVRIKAADFKGIPEIKVIADDQLLNYDNLRVKSTQGWAVHHAVFNSLDHTNANLYLGAWGAQSGSLWFDDARVEEVGLLNLVRREGAPLVVHDESGKQLTEGKDFEPLSDPNMGNHPWKGAYDVWHEPPVIRTSLPDGTRLRVSYYYAATVLDGQAMICLSEPRTIELLRDQARRMHKAWNAKGYMMSHDEIRLFNWCAACQKRRLDAGALLADNVRTCTKILREVNPGGDIYVWSDMFDPNHNARDKYYLVRGNLGGSWEGLDSGIIVVPWYFEKRNESLQWFADRGHKQVIAGYYDSAPERVLQWLEAASHVKGVQGVIYTTWEQKYGDLEKFAEYFKSYKP